MGTIQKPKIEGTLENYSFERKIDDSYIERVFIENQEIPDFLVDGFEFDRCSLKKINFSNSRVHFSFVDSIIEFSDCSNLSWMSQSMIRCLFNESKFVGWSLSEELVRDVIFDHCDFSLANFSDIKFQNVVFQNCLFKDTRFFSCQFKNVEFVECRLEGVEVFRSPLKDVDISTSTLIGGKFCIEDLKGAIVNTEQALLLSKLLGMVIRDTF